MNCSNVKNLLLLPPCVFSFLSLGGCDDAFIFLHSRGLMLVYVMLYIYVSAQTERREQWGKGGGLYEGPFDCITLKQ